MPSIHLVQCRRSFFACRRLLLCGHGLAHVWSLYSSRPRRCCSRTRCRTWRGQRGDLLSGQRIERRPLCSGLYGIRRLLFPDGLADDVSVPVDLLIQFEEPHLKPSTAFLTTELWNGVLGNYLPRQRIQEHLELPNFIVFPKP